jgi:hypothetical protein
MRLELSIGPEFPRPRRSCSGNEGPARGRSQAWDSNSQDQECAVLGIRALHKVEAKCGTQIPRTIPFLVITWCKEPVEFCFYKQTAMVHLRGEEGTSHVRFLKIKEPCV